MIVQLKGQLVSKNELSVELNVGGIHYEVFVPSSVYQRIEESIVDGEVVLKIYHYFQLTQSTATPIMIGFLSEVERDFFLQFIKVSGIGPRAAIKALNKPISEITQAIDQGDVAYLKTLPGIGLQKAKDVIAKLQGKVSRFGLIQDSHVKVFKPTPRMNTMQTEALDVLLQLQYKRNEAQAMIDQAIERNEQISTVEALLTEIYKQKVHV